MLFNFTMARQPGREQRKQIPQWHEQGSGRERSCRISGGLAASTFLVEKNIFSASYYIILDGAGNTASGMYSAILGGSGNNDGGFAYAGVFGQNVNAVAANTFHVECLNAANTPNTAAGPFPAGTVFWKAFSALAPTDKVLVIQ